MFITPYITTESIIILLSIVLVIYPISLAVYRIWFHPLSRFPGPKLAAATKWYEAYFDLCEGIGGQFSKEVAKMHEKYGPVVRINPHELHISDPEFFEVLYAGQPNPRDKYPPAAAMLGTNFGTFGTVDHHLHRKRRTAQSVFFSKRSITAAEPLIHKHVERFCTYLKEHSKEVINLRVRFLAFTSDVLCDWAFGKSFDMQLDDASAIEFDKTLSAVATVAPFVKQAPWALKFGMSLPLPLVKVLAPPVAKVLAMKHVRLYHKTVLEQSLTVNRVFTGKPRSLKSPKTNKMRSQTANHQQYFSSSRKVHRCHRARRALLVFPTKGPNCS